MYTIAKNEHSRSSSFAVAQSLFQQLLAIRKTGTFAQLVHDLADHRRKFCAIFDPTAKGTVPIDDIWVMLLMNALPDEEFLFMKETMYAKDLKVAFPQFAVVLQEMQNYDLNKKKAIPKPEAIAPVGPTILSASTTIPAKTKCGICSKMFNRTMKRDGSGEFLNCYTCSTKAREAKAAAAAIPTAAQVKKAQAVILAANVHEKATVEPSLPPPTQREADSVSSYMLNYSLTATATTTNQVHDNSSNSPWMIDSGSTFSVTNNINDIIQPVPLPTPIPITGADGAIIYATHVGSSSLGTLIHHVPQSAVKLVSLGSLTASGYMVHTSRDRSIVITTPTGAALCSCPIQSNNTWIFPGALMSAPEKNPPPTAVTNGFSGASGAIVLPFNIPRESRHFSKEEVKRATEARQLHHFLSHPNDQALKAISPIILILPATMST